MHLPDVHIFAICVLAAYLIGSVPFGLIIGRIAGLGDVRKYGSGNIGATNLTRVGGRKLGFITLLLDGGKGALATFIPDMIVLADMLVLPEESVWMAHANMCVLRSVAAFAAVTGHIFPIWLRFRGGKGVATLLASWTAVYYPLGLLACGTWLVTFAITRYSSLSALIAIWLSFVVFFITFTMMQELIRFEGLVILLMTNFICVVTITLKHRENIIRLIKGKESKFGGMGGDGK